MGKSTIIDELGQVSAADAGTVFRGWLRGEVRGLIADLLAEEVTALCGAAHHPRADSDCRRWGSAPTGVRIDGERQELKRPRVRRVGEDRSEEFPLASYEAVRNADDLRESILRAVAAGVSSRDQGELYPRWPSRAAARYLGCGWWRAGNGLNNSGSVIWLPSRSSRWCSTASPCRRT